MVEIFQIEVQANGEKDVGWEGEVRIEANVQSVRLFEVSEKPNSNSLTLKLENGSAEFQLHVFASQIRVPLIVTTKETIQLIAQSVSEPELKAEKTIAVVAKPIVPPPADVIINQLIRSNAWTCKQHQYPKYIQANQAYRLPPTRSILKFLPLRLNTASPQIPQ